VLTVDHVPVPILEVVVTCCQSVGFDLVVRYRLQGTRRFVTFDLRGGSGLGLSSLGCAVITSRSRGMGGAAEPHALSARTKNEASRMRPFENVIVAA